MCLCVCLSDSVCLSVHGRTPTLLQIPGCNWGRDRGCPLVVQYWADLQSVHGLRCYGNITRTLVNKLASIPRYDAIVRTLGGICARCWPVTGCRWGGVLNITAAASTAGFHWWRSDNITRTQNVSEYMIVLALCLVCISVTWNDRLGQPGHVDTCAAHRPLP